MTVATASGGIDFRSFYGLVINSSKTSWISTGQQRTSTRTTRLEFQYLVRWDSILSLPLIIDDVFHDVLAEGGGGSQ